VVKGDRDRFGWAGRRDLEAAIQRAFYHCSRKTTNCSVYYTKCGSR
jgi:hypothetical protein